MFLVLVPVDGRYVVTYMTKEQRYNQYSELSGEDKAIPITGREGPYGCKTSRFPNFPEQWYSTFFVRVPPYIICLQLCTPKVVGA
jgi:hypothetical protein